MVFWTRLETFFPQVYKVETAFGVIPSRHSKVMGLIPHNPIVVRNFMSVLVSLWGSANIAVDKGTET